MHPSTRQACIDACNDCATACTHCAAACLKEDPAALADCIAHDIDCAQICRLTASFLARESWHDTEACALCARICDACADICEEQRAEQCLVCAQACRRCAEACRTMNGSRRGVGLEPRAASLETTH